MHIAAEYDKDQWQWNYDVATRKLNHELKLNLKLLDFNYFPHKIFQQMISVILESSNEADARSSVFLVNLVLLSCDALKN